MKSIRKTIALVLLTIILFNCSKDDDNLKNNEQTTQQLLIGKWYYAVTSKGTATACEAQTYYHFTDAKTMEYQHVVDDFGINVGGAELIENCWFSKFPPINYTLNEANEIQFLDDYENTVSLKIISISDTKLVLTKDLLDHTTIFILTKEL